MYLYAASKSFPPCRRNSVPRCDRGVPVYRSHSAVLANITVSVSILTKTFFHAALALLRLEFPLHSTSLHLCRQSMSVSRGIRQTCHVPRLLFTSWLLQLLPVRSLLNSFRRIQKSAAISLQRRRRRRRRRRRNIPLLCTLHWLPLHARITYKLKAFRHKRVNNYVCMNVRLPLRLFSSVHSIASDNNVLAVVAIFTWLFPYLFSLCFSVCTCTQCFYSFIYFTTLLAYWDSPIGNLGRIPWGKPAATGSHYENLQCMPFLF